MMEFAPDGSWGASETLTAQSWIGGGNEGPPGVGRRSGHVKPNTGIKRRKVSIEMKHRTADTGRKLRT